MFRRSNWLGWGLVAPTLAIPVLAACGEGTEAGGDSLSLEDEGAAENPPALPVNMGPTPGGNANPGSPAGTSSPSPPIVDGEGNEVEVVPDLEDEEEVLVQFELPSAGERYVYAANPDNDSVSVIDSETLAIQSVEAGDQPTFLQSLGGSDAAVVLNVNSGDATIVRTRDGKSTASEVDVVAGSNAIAVSPNGQAAVVYFNVDLRSTGPSGSFQDLSVILLEEGQDTSVGMTVGFRPRAVHFSQDGARAFVVTEDGISILDFETIRDEGSHIATTIPLGDASEPQAVDVSITPDGKYALSRPADEGVLRLTSLTDPTARAAILDLTEVFRRAAIAPAPDAGVDSDSTAVSFTSEPSTSEVDSSDAANDDGGTSQPALDGGVDAAATTDEAESTAPALTTDVTTEAPPDPVPDPDAPLEFVEITDVDLAPTGEFAIAVFRDRRTVLKVPIPSGFDDLDNVSVITVGNQIVGSVNIAPNGEHALLYTTAQDTNEHLSILDIEEETLRVVRLPKSVRAINMAPDSKSALVIHRKLEGDPNEANIDPDVLIDRSYGYSVLRLDDGFSKLQLTSSAPGRSTIVPDGSNMFILFNSPTENIRDVHRVTLQNFLVQPLTLGSAPISLGAVPGTSKVFVGQDHPDGRITFIDWKTAETQSVTGFELNSRIRE